MPSSWRRVRHSGCKSGGQVDGALINGAQWTSQGLSVASGAFVEVANSAALDISGGASTVSVWVKGDYASQPAWAVLFSKNNSSSYWQIYRNSGTGDYGLDLGSLGYVVFAGSAFQNLLNGKWNLFTWVQSAGTAYIYINKTLIDSKSITNPGYGVGSFRVGTDISGSYSTTALFKNVNVFKRAMVQAEIYRLYDELFAGIISPDDRLFFAMRGLPASPSP